MSKRTHGKRRARSKRGTARKARGRRRSPRQRWMPPTPEQQQLHDELQSNVALGGDPLSREALTEELARLRTIIGTLTQQRDDALQQHLDQVNLPIAVRRLGQQTQILREAVEEIAKAISRLQDERRRLDAETKRAQSLTAIGS